MKRKNIKKGKVYIIEGQSVPSHSFRSGTPVEPTGITYIGTTPSYQGSIQVTNGEYSQYVSPNDLRKVKLTDF